MSGKHWVTEPNGYLEPKVAKSGFASLKPATVIERFQETVRKHGSEKALCVKPIINVKSNRCYFAPFYS